MVDIKSVAKSLEDGLNALTNEFTIIVTPIVGDFAEGLNARKEQLKELGKPIINGLLIPLPSSIVPIKDLNNFYLTTSLQFIVKTEVSNDFNNILNSYVEQNIGSALRFGDYVGIVGFDVPTVGQASIEPGIGDSVPLSLIVYYQLIKNGVLSNECEIILDGDILLPLDFDFSRVRIAQTDNVSNNAEMESVISQQGLTINITVAYQTKPVAIKLVNDILQGKLNTDYTFSYADGFAGIPSGGVVSLNVILTNGSVSYQAGKVPLIKATFIIDREDIYNVGL